MAPNKKRATVVCHDIYGKRSRVPVSKLTFRPSVYGVVIERGKILLSGILDGYDLPGGAIELHETIEQALIREVWEETGYRVKPTKLITCSTTFFTMPETRQPVHSILMYYQCKKISGQLSTRHLTKMEKQYECKPMWMDLITIPKLKFYSSTNIPAVIKQSLK